MERGGIRSSGELSKGLRWPGDWSVKFNYFILFSLWWPSRASRLGWMALQCKVGWWGYVVGCGWLSWRGGVVQQDQGRLASAVATDCRIMPLLFHQRAGKERRVAREQLQWAGQMRERVAATARNKHYKDSQLITAMTIVCVVLGQTVARRVIPLFNNLVLRFKRHLGRTLLAWTPFGENTGKKHNH